MKKNISGQSLFEVLFATVLAALIVTGVASVAIVSLRNAEFARSQSEARQLAQNLLEDARVYRDDNPDCIKDNNCVVNTSCPQFVDSCSVTFEYNIVNDTATVTANVVWIDGRGFHVISTSTILTSWQD